MKKFGAYLKDRNVYEYYDEPLFIQSEYYNVHFQKAIEELGDKLDIKSILTTSAQEVAYAQFSRLFEDKKKYDIEERKKAVESYFSSCGFGKLNLKPIQAKGGNIEVASEHYAQAWVKHFGNRSENEPGVGYFTQGFLCGMMEAVFNCRPGTFDGKQLKCISKGDGLSKFEVYRGFRRKISVSPAMGKTQELFSEETKEYANDLVDAIVDMELSGLKDEEGLINEFDQTLTMHYANYFALASIKLLMQANKKLGPEGFKTVKSILTSTSEKNAYFMFGKILNSDLWKKNQAASNGEAGGLKSCMDLLTAFGLGHWELKETGTSQTRVDVINSPQTNAYLKLVGNAKIPIGFYNGGILVGISNLLDKSSTSSGEVNNEYVDDLANGNSYSFVEDRSRMTGGDSDTLVINRD